MTPTVTTIIISDPELLAKLAAAGEGSIVFKAPSGECVRTVATVPFGKLPPGVKSPFTDEEIEEARKEPDSGITLDEFWRRVQNGQWR
ncbi:MAG TPA: hypothetical protein VKE74_06670 [Gemmataceae bacterium]|nr:hypothetical protein [Gemmataceae bacterium]